MPSMISTHLSNVISPFQVAFDRQVILMISRKSSQMHTFLRLIRVYSVRRTHVKVRLNLVSS